MKRDTLRNDIAHCDHYIRILEDMISSERAKLRAVLGNGKRLDEEITVGRNVNAKDPLVEEKMKKVEVVEFLEKSIEKLRDKVRDLEAVRTTSRGELEMVEWRLGEGRLVYEGKEGKKEAARRMVEGFRKKREEGRVVHKRVWGVVEGDGCDCCLGMKGE